MIGGLGSGKTRTGAEAFVDVILANPGCQFLMAGPTHEMTADLCIPAFEKACPKGLILDYSKSEKWYALKGGRFVKHASADKPATLEGKTIAGFWADEARYWKRKSWENLIARLRDVNAKAPQGLVTTTPAMNWLATEFDAGKKGREVYRASTIENAHNLDPEYIADLRTTYSPRLFKSLVEGFFSVVEGQVYEAFDDARHLVDWKYDPRLPVFAFQDFGVRKAAVLFAQETGNFPTHLDGHTLPPHSLIVFDELQPEQKPTERVVPMMRAVLKKHGIRGIDAVYCDPAGNARDLNSGMTSVHTLQAEFGRVVSFQTDPRHTWIPNGVGMVESALNPLEGDPTLYLDRRLSQRTARETDNDYSRGVYKSLRGYSYPEAKNGRTSDHPAKDGTFDHCCDALRYGVVGAVLAGRRGPPQRIGIRYGS